MATGEQLKKRFRDDLSTDSGPYIDGSVMPTPTFIILCYELGKEEAITSAGQYVAFKGTVAQLESGEYENFQSSEMDAGVIVEINHAGDIFLLNGLGI